MNEYHQVSETPAFSFWWIWSFFLSSCRSDPTLCSWPAAPQQYWKVNAAVMHSLVPSRYLTSLLWADHRAVLPLSVFCATQRVLGAPPQLFTCCQPVVCESYNGTPSCRVGQAVCKSTLGSVKNSLTPPLNAAAALPTLLPKLQMWLPLGVSGFCYYSYSTWCLCWSPCHCFSGSFRGQIKVFLLDFKGNSWSGFRKAHMWICELLWHTSSCGRMQTSKFRMQQIRAGDRASWLKRLVCSIDSQRKVKYV